MINQIADFYSYLVRANPGHTFKFYAPLLILASVLIISALYIRSTIKANKADKAFKMLFKPYISPLSYLGVLILFYLVARWYNIGIISWRPIIFGEVLAAVYLGYKIYQTNKSYPAAKNAHEELMRKNMYLKKK